MSNANKIQPVLVIAGVLGIDTSNAAQSQMLFYSCDGITDMWAFVDYVRDHHAGISFAKATTKLDILSTEYKKLQTEALYASKMTKASAEVKELIEKCQSCLRLIEGKRAEGYHADWEHAFCQGEPLFSIAELRALSDVGSFVYVAERLKTHMLQDDLTNVFKRRLMKPKSYEQLTSRLEETKKITKG